MYRVIQKCKKCKGPISESYLSDKGEENYAMFFITYCPNCIKLGQEIPAIVWGHTVKKEKLEPPKTTPKFKVSRSKKKKK